MSVHKYTNFGRTRQLKNIAGAHEAEVDVVLVATLDDSTDGYSTESQRFLHVLVIDKHNSTNLTVAIYGYSHAFGKWFPVNQLNSSTAATVEVTDSGTAEGSQTANHREMVTFEIAGIDRVAFVGTTADVRVLAACSTF
mgnify:CR=1 FL=1|tara:strand:- start:13 stop:429 length:417 start_codon:yes stop_codon:yes gene_type:complete